MIFYKLKMGYIILCLTFFLMGCKVFKEKELISVNKMPSMFQYWENSDLSKAEDGLDLFQDSLLRKYIELSFEKNFSLLKTKAEMLNFYAEYQRNKSVMFPKIEAYAGVSQRKFGTFTMDGAGNSTTPIANESEVPIHLKDFNFGIQTLWEIDVWGKLKQQKKASFTRFLAAEETQQLIKTWIVEQLTHHYYRLIFLDERKEIVLKNIKLNDDLIEILKSKKEAFKVTELSVKQFQALQWNYKNQLLKFEQEIFYSENLIRQLTATYGMEIERSKLNFNQLPTLNFNVGSPENLVEKRPDLRQLALELQAKNLDVLVAKKMFFPRLSLEGSFGNEAYRTKFLFLSPASIAYSILGGLAMPLFNLGELKANLRIQRVNAQIGNLEFHQRQMEAFFEVENSLLAIRKSTEMLENKRFEIEDLQTARAISRELFNANRADYLDVLFTQQSTLNSELELIDLIEEKLNWNIFLYKAIGGGW